MKNLENKNTYKQITKAEFIREVAENWNDEKFLQKVDYYLSSSADWIRFNETYTVKKTYYGSLAELICQGYLKDNNIPFEKDIANEFIYFGPDGDVNKPANLKNRSDIKVQGVNTEIKHINVNCWDYTEAARKAQTKALKENAKILMLVNFRDFTLTIWRYDEKNNAWFYRDNEHDIPVVKYSNI